MRNLSLADVTDAVRELIARAAPGSAGGMLDREYALPIQPPAEPGAIAGFRMAQ